MSQVIRDCFEVAAGTPEAVLVYLLKLIYLQEAGTAGQPNRGNCFITKNKKKLGYLEYNLFLCINYAAMNSIIQGQLGKIRALCKQHKVKSLYSFGSVNTPEFTDKSDIDLLIDFEAGISVEDYTDNYFSLREKFAQLFKRDVDLVTRRSLSNPFFIREVEQSKHLIYG